MFPKITSYTHPENQQIFTEQYSYPSLNLQVFSQILMALIGSHTRLYLVVLQLNSVSERKLYSCLFQFVSQKLKICYTFVKGCNYIKGYNYVVLNLALLQTLIL